MKPQSETFDYEHKYTILFLRLSFSCLSHFLITEKYILSCFMVVGDYNMLALTVSHFGSHGKVRPQLPGLNKNKCTKQKHWDKTHCLPDLQRNVFTVD